MADPIGGAGGDLRPLFVRGRGVCYDPLQFMGRESIVTNGQKTALRVGNECYLRVMGRNFLVEILGLAEDTIWVSFPAGNYPVEGQGVDLEFHDSSGYLCYHTRVAIGPKKKGDGIVLQRAEAATFLEHRRTWRVPVDLKVRIQRVVDRQEGMGRLVNLSAQGALVETRAPLALGHSLSLTIPLPDGPPITVSADVIHTGPWTWLAQPRFGIRFTQVPAGARQRLTRFLWKRIRKHYARELDALYPGRRRSKRRGRMEI